MAEPRQNRGGQTGNSGTCQRSSRPGSVGSSWRSGGGTAGSRGGQGTFENKAEVVDCLVFAKLAPDDVEIVVDVPVMAILSAWT